MDSQNSSPLVPPPQSQNNPNSINTINDTSPQLPPNNQSVTDAISSIRDLQDSIRERDTLIANLNVLLRKERAILSFVCIFINAFYLFSYRMHFIL
jgi:hypothetical protein